MKLTIFKNKINGEQYICENSRAIEVIDGVEYLTVHRVDNMHNCKIRRDAVDRVKVVDTTN